MLRTGLLPILLLLVLSNPLGAQVSACTSEGSPRQVASGLSYTLLCRGSVAHSPGYRVLIGTYDSQSEASEVLRAVEAVGISALPYSEGSDYQVFATASPSRKEAAATRAALLRSGFDPPLSIQMMAQDLTHRGGPWQIHLLEADPRRVSVQVAHAFDAAIGLEETVSLAQRKGALAAINGGYFRMTGLLAGDSQGVLEIDGKLLSEPDRGRGALGFYRQDGVTRSVFGRLSFQGRVVLASGESFPLDGLNRRRKDSEVLLFTPEFHRTTLTSPEGAEAAIVNGRLAEIREGTGSMEIPCGGQVLSLGSERLDQVLSSLRLGEDLRVDMDLIPLLADPDDQWQKADFILGAGPLLLLNGQRFEDPAQESMSRVFYLARHPRTAVGVRPDGTLLFLTVDGRRPQESVGMSIPELADLFLELGAVSALNLDGGGSSTMVIEGQIINTPSSSSGPRHNADAILLFPAEPQS